MKRGQRRSKIVWGIKGLGKFYNFEQRNVRFILFIMCFIFSVNFQSVSSVKLR